MMEPDGECIEAAAIAIQDEYALVFRQLLSSATATRFAYRALEAQPPVTPTAPPPEPAAYRAGLEAAADIASAVYTSLSADGNLCACGNGRVPVTSYRVATERYAAAIRALPILHAPTSAQGLAIEQAPFPTDFSDAAKRDAR